MTNKILYRLTAIFAAIILGACGGGGGSSSPSGSGDTPDAPLAITIVNAEDVSASALLATDSTLQSGSGTLVLSADIDSESNQFELRSFIRHFLTHLPESAFQNADLATGIALPATTFDCADSAIGGISGQVRISGNVASISTYSTGDRINSEFFNCEILPGLIGDGTFNIVVNSFSGDPALSFPPYRLDANITFEDFNFRSGLDSYFADGDMRLDFDLTVGNIATISASGSLLTVREGASEQVRLFNYNIDSVADNVGGTFVQDQSGTFDSVLLGGSVNFTTLVTFEGNIGNNPDTGTFLLTGAGNSAARVVVIDDTNVQVFVDEDGDGTFAAPFIVSWDALML